MSHFLLWLARPKAHGLDRSRVALFAVVWVWMVGAVAFGKGAQVPKARALGAKRSTLNGKRLAINFPDPPIVGHLDASLRQSSTQAWVGEDIINTTAAWQESTANISPVQTAVFLFKFHTRNASPCVTVTLPDWNQFLTDGWSVHFYDAAQGGHDITSLITREEGWTSPLSDHQHGSFNNTWVDPDTTIRAEVQADYVGLMYENHSFLVRGRTPTANFDGNGEVVEDDVKATIYAHAGGPAVQPDLEVQQVGANSWDGLGIYAPKDSPTTVAGSSNGSTLKYLVKVTNRGTLRRQFTLKEAENADWKATIFDDAENGTDITTAFQTGYDVVLAGGESRTLRVEVTLNAQGHNGDGQIDISATDETLSDWVRINTTLSPVQPDVSLEGTDEGIPLESVGDDVLNDDTKETLQALVTLGETHNFRVHIKNTGQNATTFCVKMQLPVVAGGAPQPWAHQGWSASIKVDGQTSELAAQLQSASGWTTPSLAPGSEQVLDVSLSSTTGADTELDGSFRISAQSGSLTDAVVGQLKVQSLAKIQWSRDGQSWEDVTATSRLVIEQDETIGLRALKAVPSVDWPDSQPIGPTWKWNTARIIGETVWLAGEDVTSTGDKTATATLGTQSQSVAIRIVPACDVLLSVANATLLAGSGTPALTSTEVKVRVSNDANAPLGTTKVRLRALDEAGEAVGKWNGATASHQDVTMGTDGFARATWTTGSAAGQVRLEAVVLGEGDEPRDTKDSLDIEVHKPYARVDTGAWVETNGSWSRTVKVSTWFIGQKIGGRAIVLSSLVKDYETEQPMTGWECAAPFDAATGTTDAQGNFSTVQRWNPVEADTWPHDYIVGAKAGVQ